MSIKTQVEDLLETIDLSQSSPPFLEKTITQLRTQLFTQTDSAFRYWLDNEALPHFLHKVEQAYFNLINQAKVSSESVGLDPVFVANLKRNDEYARLARLLARWNVEIELSVDIIERACLYKLYARSSLLPDINQEIRRNWGLKDETLLKRGVIRVLNFAAYSTQSLSKEIVQQTTSALSLNFANLRTTAITSLLYMCMGSTFPIALMHVIGTQAAVVMGGWVASKAGENIHSSIDRLALKSRLKGLDSQLEGILTQLTYANAQCAHAITSCLEQGTEGSKLHLNRLLSQLLVERPSIEDLQGALEEEADMLARIHVTEEDDYLLVELEEPDDFEIF